ncbi:MAG UNVERIFIED_CONTAM: hypothetical protein LVT10_25035 [Anaerolineae bacterium]
MYTEYQGKLSTQDLAEIGGVPLYFTLVEKLLDINLSVGGWLYSGCKWIYNAGHASGCST